MRIAFGVEYQGTHYYGWQLQDNVMTVQQQVELAFSKVANHPIEVVCAGRTDKGVHALGQVGHFDSTSERTNYAWLMGANTHLPPDIRITWVQPVTENFHARYSANARRYFYLIYNHAVFPAIFHQQVSWYRWPLEIHSMQAAAQHLLGEHDFSAFRGIDCQAKTAIREVHHIKLLQKDNFILMDIKANAFLHHMVRNIAGVLLEIGTGKREINWALEVLQSRQRQCAGITAPASGLYLYEVYYPTEFNFLNKIPNWFFNIS